MKRKLRALITASLLSIISFSGYCQTNSKNSISIVTGLTKGFGINASFTINDIAEGLSGNFRFGIGYNRLNPGNYTDARRIFINNTTNGVPEKRENLSTIDSII